MEIARRQLGENTRAVHLPPPPETAQRPLGTPVYRTAAFAFSSAQEYAAVLGDQMPGYSYSRIDNPTVDAFARAVAAMEGANLPRWPAAQAFASGMAAISGVFLAFARAGAHEQVDPGHLQRRDHPVQQLNDGLIELEQHSGQQAQGSGAAQNRK